MLPQSIEWISERKILKLLDQRKLPGEVAFCLCKSSEDIAQAIENMTVRGAPAIGVAAAYGTVLAASESRQAFQEAVRRLSATRPTAKHLFWTLEKMKNCAAETPDGELCAALEKKAAELLNEDIEINMAIGKYGADLLPDNAEVITHCNAGAIATCGYGTALGVLRAARGQGKKIKVYADETRPRLQGARLTAWELLEDGFDVTLITDSMAAFLMTQRKIDAVFVGADRVARNGDTANKIGTYSLAVAAKRHKVPFYAAAPFSTIDTDCADGSRIPIEERSIEEVVRINGKLTAPEGIKVWNPAFDVTPAELIDGIITEKGVVRAPYDLKKFMEEAE